MSRAAAVPSAPPAPCRAAAGRILLLSLALSCALLLVLWLFRARLRAMWLRHRRGEEIRRCRGYIADHPDSEEAAALQYKIARLFQESLRDHARAVVEFKRFLERHAGHPLAENAQYYLARSWEELGNPARAQLEFARLLKRHPGGLRENDAKIRIEEITARIGENLTDALLAGEFPEDPVPDKTDKTNRKI